MSVSEQWFIQWRHSLPPIPAIDRQYTDPRTTYSWAHFLTHDPESTRYRQSAPYSGVNKSENCKGVFRGYQYRKQQNERVKNEDRYRGGMRMFGAAMWLSTLTATQGRLNSRDPSKVSVDRESPPFYTLYKWSQLDFEFPSAQYRDEALATGDVSASDGKRTQNDDLGTGSRGFFISPLSSFDIFCSKNWFCHEFKDLPIAYIPENVLPLGIEVWQDRVFVTVPNWKKGLPATLCTVPRGGGFRSPLLRPYPDWTYHRYGGGNCSGLTSVFRVSADQCGRLWVLDSGKVEAVDNAKQLCPPAIVVFDLSNDRLIARYNIPEKYVLQNSLFSNIVVDIRDAQCLDTHVYIADTWRFGLLVFRESDQQFWRFSHHLFYPDPFASNFSLHGVKFQWPDGIFGLSLSPLYKNERTLFFHPMASFREFYVRTSVLRYPEAVKDSADDFNLLGESRGDRGQVSASAIDRRGVMFYNLVLKDSVGCWNVGKPYRQSNQGLIATNHKTMIFPNDIKVDQEPRQSVWVITNRLPMFQKGPLEPYDYNFRIMYADTAEAVRGTVCDPVRRIYDHDQLH